MGPLDRLLRSPSVAAFAASRRPTIRQIQPFRESQCQVEADFARSHGVGVRIGRRQGPQRAKVVVWTAKTVEGPERCGNPLRCRGLGDRVSVRCAGLALCAGVWHVGTEGTAPTGAQPCDNAGPSSPPDRRPDRPAGTRPVRAFGRRDRRGIVAVAPLGPMLCLRGREGAWRTIPRDGPAWGDPRGPSVPIMVETLPPW